MLDSGDQSTHKMTGRGQAIRDPKCTHQALVPAYQLGELASIPAALNQAHTDQILRILVCADPSWHDYRFGWLFRSMAQTTTIATPTKSGMQPIDHNQPPPAPSIR